MKKSLKESLFGRVFFNPYVFLMLLATLLLLPSISLGFILDDYIFLQKLILDGVSHHLFNLYTFSSHGEAAQLMANGFWPWWGDPAFKMDFFRPLSSLFFAINFMLFGKHPLAFHVHLLLWVFGLLFIWYRILDMLLPRKITILALMVFITSGVFIFPVFFAAESHIVLAAVMGSLGLWCHLLYRQNHWKYGLPLSLLAFVCGLLTSEATVGILIYLFCYEWIFSKDNVSRRLAVLLPYALLIIIYCVIYKIFQYGTYMDYYFDPFHDPLTFIKNALLQFPLLFNKLYFGFFFQNNFIANIIIVAAIGSILWLFLRSERNAKSVYYWFALSSVFSLLPVLTIRIDPHLVLRMLLPSMIGASVIIAAFIVEASWEKRKALLAKGGLNLVFAAYALYLTVMYFVVFPHTMLILPKYVNRFNQLIVSAATHVKLNNACQYVVNIAAPDYMSSFFFPSIRTYYDLPTPKNWYVLSENAKAADFIKTAPYQFLLVAQYNNYSYDKSEHIFKNNQLKNGDVFQTKLFRATVVDSKNQTPTKAIFKFDGNNFNEICWISSSPVKRQG